MMTQKEHSKPEIIFGIVRDIGNDWQNGSLAHLGTSLREVMEWAERNNHQAASVVMIDKGIRYPVKVND